MRSRYTAFALDDSAYLLRSWHRNTRPKSVELDPLQDWYRLDIGRILQGGIFDDAGIVAFRAFYRHPNGNGEHTEVSRFVRENGVWFYLGAE